MADEVVLKIQQELLKLSQYRNELAAQRTYMNTERTLSVWIRTALAIMIFGIAVAKLELIVNQLSGISEHINHTAHFLQTIGALLIIFSIFMALSSGWRFAIYARKYKETHQFPDHHKPWLPIIYACMIALFGIVLIILMLLF